MKIIGKAANIYIVVFECNSKLLNQITNKIFPVNGIIRSYLKVILKEAKFAYKNDLRIFDYNELIENPNAPLGAKQMLKNYAELLLIKSSDKVRKIFKIVIPNSYEKLSLCKISTATSSLSRL